MDASQQLVLAVAILYKNVGTAFIVTLIATIISIVITIPVIKQQKDCQDKLMVALSSQENTFSFIE
jgi:hypothetical protein